MQHWSLVGAVRSFGTQLSLVIFGYRHDLAWNQFFDHHSQQIIEGIAMCCMVITREEYREKLFAPLGNTFGVPIVFNGENASNRISGGRTLGIYVHNDRAIVIRYRDCPVSLYRTTAHEIGHACDSTLNPETLRSLEPYLQGGHKSYSEALAWFVSYWALRYAGVDMPGAKGRSDELIAKHERIYRRYKVEPLKLNIFELMEIAEVIAIVAKPGLMEMLTGFQGNCRHCDLGKDSQSQNKPCELLAKPVVEKVDGRAKARRKQRRGRM
jgi:hypothetical protein